MKVLDFFLWRKIGREVYPDAVREGLLPAQKVQNESFGLFLWRKIGREVYPEAVQ
jgi:hypothetical protein